MGYPTPQNAVQGVLIDFDLWIGYFSEKNVLLDFFVQLPVASRSLNSSSGFSSTGFTVHCDKPLHDHRQLTWLG